jgi:hypothetical protein
MLPEPSFVETVAPSLESTSIGRGKICRLKLVVL